MEVEEEVEEAASQPRGQLEKMRRRQPLVEPRMAEEESRQVFRQWCPESLGPRDKELTVKT